MSSPSDNKHNVKDSRKFTDQQQDKPQQQPKYRLHNAPGQPETPASGWEQDFLERYQLELGHANAGNLMPDGKEGHKGVGK